MFRRRRRPANLGSCRAIGMFTTEPQAFESKGLLTTVAGFAKCLHWLLRQMTAEEFLRCNRGNP